MLNRRLWGPLCWVMAFFTASYRHLLWTPTHQGPNGPFGLMWLSLPYVVYNSIRSLTATLQGLQGPFGLMWLYLPLLVILPPTLTGTRTSVLTELYNSSTPTQSPTWSLKSHVWSSSSGNNCHAVHRLLSSGVLVYECTMGIFLPHPISSANFRPRDFLS